MPRSIIFVVGVLTIGLNFTNIFVACTKLVEVANKRAVSEFFSFSAPQRKVLDVFVITAIMLIVCF